MNSPKNNTAGKCRFCNIQLEYTFVDLGMSPLCESFVKQHDLNRMEVFYPLHVYVCSQCFLVQLEEFVSPKEIYSDYNYFSSYSDSWLRHSKRYTDKVVDRFEIGPNHLVAELASNDGYLLQYFLEKQIPVLGIEPSVNVAQYAIKKGIRTEVEFFGTHSVHGLINTYGKADLLIGNNVLAHVPDIKDFVHAMRLFLQPDGVITMEFPHLLRLMEGNQFDTIYHEHFSYLSLSVVDKIFSHLGLTLFDVEELPSHGGSLRIYAKHKTNSSHVITPRVHELLAIEAKSGIYSLDFYSNFTAKVKETKWKILEFLIQARRDGKTIVGYGAPGKGNTLLNYCGVRTDLLDYTVDRNPHKHGNYLPGTRIPILHPDEIKNTRPDYIFILPWNLKNEIIESLSFIGDWGGQFVVPIPEVKVLQTREAFA